MNVRATLALCLVAFGSHAFAAEEKIHILSTRMGDPQAKKTCAPKLAMCEGVAKCEFDVNDSLCKVPAGAEVVILLVTFQCDKGPKKNVAAYSGQRMSLIKCP